ncbi:CoaE-domain-containing protein [Macrolepiota fuliginosa MF-IS2]|uniref:CoaE-domain-containing protein n=1 Tax=Macrolepiota fuliginosa MF-IS2 TaxID=1400762 RepID=A0A9P5XFL4_9AGAR|nr:CoaE-domain-containing protein [Macrolepiota fuliginosa MF-IS2]
MLVVGLTGGIATGKSTVSSILKTHKVPIVDADVIARQVVEPGTPALAKIKKTFGDDILLPDGALDRKKLGSIVFTDESQRKKLNSIIHPAVRRAMLFEVICLWLRGERWCVADVPLLIEGPLWKLVGSVVVVYCSAELQLLRLMLRDSSSREDASARLNSQLPIASKIEYADIIIDNSGSRAELDHQVVAFINKMNSQVGNVRWLFSWLIPPVGIVLACWTLVKRNILSRRKRRT